MLAMGAGFSWQQSEPYVDPEAMRANCSLLLEHADSTVVL